MFSLRVFLQLSGSSGAGLEKMPVLQAVFGNHHLAFYGWAEVAGCVCVLLTLARLALALARLVPGLRLLVAVVGGYTLLCAARIAGPSWDIMNGMPFMIEFPVISWVVIMMTQIFIRVFVVEEQEMSDWEKQWLEAGKQRESRFRRLMTELAARVKPASKEVN